MHLMQLQGVIMTTTGLIITTEVYKAVPFKSLFNFVSRSKSPVDYYFFTPGGPIYLPIKYWHFRKSLFKLAYHHKNNPLLLFLICIRMYLRLELWHFACIFSGTPTGQKLKSIKLLRVLRPLKTINRNTQLREFVL